MSFERDLSRFGDRAADEIDKACRKITLETFRGVILKTPVDTGRARGAWGIGADPADRLDPSGGAAVADVVQALRPGVFRNGGEMVLSNNLPYIGRLEYGYSQQAPGGMVRLTLTEIVSKYR